MKELNGGFSFCGYDIADFHIQYAPDLSTVYVYSPTQGTPHTEVFAGHDGGYYYGNSLKPKEFVLRCWFEGNVINEGFMTQMYALFSKGKTGRLVFKKRPWCYYVATVLENPVFDLRNYMNGLVTIKLSAMYPFARSDLRYIDDTEDNWKDILNNSALMVGREWDQSLDFASSSEPMTTQTELLLLNGGTEKAKVAIKIAGDVSAGVRISNATTGQQCKFVAITDDLTTDENKYIVTDGLSGKTVLTNGVASEYAFLYHDSGFIDLAPAYPCVRDIVVNLSEGSNSVTSLSGMFTEDMVGKYIYTNDNSYHSKIESVVNEYEITVAQAPEQTEAAVATVMTANEIVVSPVDSMSLTKLSFEFKPTFA